MSQSIPPVRFSACGDLQIYLVPATGYYLIEAAGAQGGDSHHAPGGRGAFLRGMFHLSGGSLVHLVVGKQGQSGTSPDLQEATPEDVASTTRARLCGGAGGGGGTFIWHGSLNSGRAAWPLLAAGGGGGGGARQPGGDARITPLPEHDSSDIPVVNGQGGPSCQDDFYYSGGGGAGWLERGANGGGPTYCQGGIHWTGGAGASFGGYLGGHGGYGGGGGGSFFGSGSGGGGGYCGGWGGGGRTGRASGGGSSYNGGCEQKAIAGVHVGDGFAIITPAAAPWKRLTPGFSATSTGVCAVDPGISKFLSPPFSRGNRAHRSPG